jgi:hypothetical protein
MQKLISDHSINHTIAENVNSGSIKQFHTYTGNFSFKISFSFLNQSLQGNLHKLLKQQLHGYQNHLKTELYLQRKYGLHRKERQQLYGIAVLLPVVWICCMTPV